MRTITCHLPILKSTAMMHPNRRVRRVSLQHHAFRNWYSHSSGQIGENVEKWRYHHFGTVGFYKLHILVGFCQLIPISISLGLLCDSLLWCVTSPPSRLLACVIEIWECWQLALIRSICSWSGAETICIFSDFWHLLNQQKLVCTCIFWHLFTYRNLEKRDRTTIVGWLWVWNFVLVQSVVFSPSLHGIRYFGWP